LEHSCKYTNPESHELGMIFSFNHLKVDYGDNDKWRVQEPDIPELRRIFAVYQQRMAAGGGWGAVFWSNHDQPRPNSRFGDTDNYWYESSTLLPTCTFFMRGTPYIFQGEELGQTINDYTDIDQYRDVESHNYYRILQEERGCTPDEAFAVVHARSRDDGRYPMAWDGTETGGFTTGTPWLALPANHELINVEREAGDPHSVLAYFKRLIQLRKDLAVVQGGDVRFVEAPDTRCIAYERILGDERLLVQCNFSGDDVPALPHDGGEPLIDNYVDEMGDVLRPWEAVVHMWR
jgi:trehalose-6-phosphate hydrolase